VCSRWNGYDTVSLRHVMATKCSLQVTREAAILPKQSEMLRFVSMYVTDWGKLHNEELHNLDASPNIIRVMDEIGGACRTHGRDEKCIQYFGCKT